MSVKILCTNCSQPFEVRPYIARQKRVFGYFCSPACRSSYIGPRLGQCLSRKVKTTCAFCQKEIWLQPYRLLNVDNNFCSTSCTMKYSLKLRYSNGPEMTTIPCAYCKKEKPILKWDLEQKLKRGQQQFFCNRQCFGQWKAANWSGENNPSWKGGWTPHGTGWERIRQVVRHEQNYKCIDCKITEKNLGRELDIHHIIPARLFKRKADASIRSNLVGLCHKCHMRRERSELPLFKV